LNDSFNNKTLCFTNENRAKKNKTPYEFYSSQGDEKWEIIKLQALNCFKTKAKYPNCYTKFKHFVKKKHDEDFISRQLNDTRYISKEAKNYLSKICTKVLVAPGQMTATLRHHWDLNSILNKEDNTKTRNDHRHHAIDALVMACSTRSHLHELTKRNRYRKNHELKDFPHPWFNFRRDAEKAVEQILVSHKKTKNILTIRTRTTIKKGVKHRNTGVAARGQLHKESVYGKRRDVFTKELNYHIRKPLILLSAAEIPKIVDLEIKKIIYKAIEEIGLNIDDNRKPIVKTREDKKLFEQLLSKPFFLTNKNGNPVPIKKIRIQKKFSNAKPLKESKNQWVDLGKNHHVLIYKDFNGNLKEDVVTFWAAVNRKRKGKEVFQLPKDGKEMVTTLQKNELFLLGLKDDDIDWENLNYNLLKKHLFKVQGLSSFFYEFRLSTDSTQNKDTKSKVFRRIQSFSDGKTGWKTHNPIKVKVNSIGKIEKI
jgi:CRISPR-associated endonuclease Csn1